MLGVSMGKSYKIFRKMNRDLEGRELTIIGKNLVKYFKEKGMTEQGGSA